MTFAADKHCAEFGTVYGRIKLFVEEHSFSRTAAIGETVLLDGSVSLYSGGANAVRIKLNGTSDKPCADILDNLLTSGAKVTLTYSGMVFTDVILTGYKCGGKSGCSEKAEVEFTGKCAAVPEAEAGGDAL